MKMNMFEKCLSLPGCIFQNITCKKSGPFCISFAKYPLYNPCKLQDVMALIIMLNYLIFNKI